jgi:hypothetical protein
MIMVQGVGFELSDLWSYRPHFPLFSFCGWLATMFI